MVNNLCSLPHWEYVSIIIVSQLAYMGLECWLGKTKKIEANSILELIFNLIKGIK
jgi:hypothetical protein